MISFMIPINKIDEIAGFDLSNYHNLGRYNDRIKFYLFKSSHDGNKLVSFDTYITIYMDDVDEDELDKYELESNNTLEEADFLYSYYHALYYQLVEDDPVINADELIILKKKIESIMNIIKLHRSFLEDK